MNKANKKFSVQDKIISFVSQNEQDYICLTDMVRNDEGDDHIRNWLRNRNTVEFIGLWETIHNPDFKPVEFDNNYIIMSSSKLYLSSPPIWEGVDKNM